MSYMDEDNILSERFFSKMKILKKAVSTVMKKLAKSGEEREYQKALRAADDALDHAEKMRKKYNVKVDKI